MLSLISNKVELREVFTYGYVTLAINPHNILRIYPLLHQLKIMDSNSILKADLSWFDNIVNEFDGSVEHFLNKY